MKQIARTVQRSKTIRPSFGFSNRTFSKYAVGQTQFSSNQQKNSSFRVPFLLLSGASLLILNEWKDSFAEAEISQHSKKISHFIKEEDLKKESEHPIVFTLFDSQNALQMEFIEQMQKSKVYQRIFNNDKNANVDHIDISLQNDEVLDKFFKLVQTDREKTKRKQRPSFFIKQGDRLTKIKASSMNQKFTSKFFPQKKRFSQNVQVTSIKELADKLKEYNRSLDDTVLVYCHDPALQDSPLLAQTFHLIRNESRNPLLEVQDEELMERLKMKKGSFYCYFKPSFINGYEQYIEKDINFDYLQAYEGVCRDEFTPNFPFLEGQEFKSKLNDNGGIFTDSFCDRIFDQCFTRTFNVEFIFNSNMNQFRRKFLTGKGASKPLMFIYSPPLYMSRYVGDFKDVLKDYTEVFDIYYTGDEQKARRFFYTKEFPDIIPFVVIVDTKKVEKVQGFENQIGGGQYFQKYRELIFFNNIPNDLKKVINKFLDGEVQNFLQTEKMKQQTLVKSIASENFTQEVIKNKDVEQCIIEVYKHDCPSCSFNGKVFNVFSRKLEKHGYLSSLPCFRLSIDNKIPQLGNFGYSPIYFYVKKRGEDIVEIKTLDPPQKVEGFLKQIGQLSKLKGFEETIKIKPREQILKHIRLEDLDENFDVDFDLIEKEEEKK